MKINVSKTVVWLTNNTPRCENVACHKTLRENVRGDKDEDSEMNEWHDKQRKYQEQI